MHLPVIDPISAPSLRDPAAQPPVPPFDEDAHESCERAADAPASTDAPAAHARAQPQCAG